MEAMLKPIGRLYDRVMDKYGIMALEGVEICVAKACDGFIYLFSDVSDKEKSEPRKRIRKKRIEGYD